MAKNGKHYQSPSRGGKGECATTVKVRRIGTNKTKAVTSRGPCARELTLWDILVRAMRKFRKNT